MSTDTRCSPSKIKFVSSAQIAYELNKGPNALRQFCLLQKLCRYICLQFWSLRARSFLFFSTKLLSSRTKHLSRLRPTSELVYFFTYGGVDVNEFVVRSLK